MKNLYFKCEKCGNYQDELKNNLCIDCEEYQLWEKYENEKYEKTLEDIYNSLYQDNLETTEESKKKQDLGYYDYGMWNAPNKFY